MSSKMDRIETCVRCGMLYESFYGRTTCPSCSLEEDQNFLKVRRYIQSHKTVGIYEASEACNVKPTLIINWIKEERLEFAEEAKVFVECEQCGFKISSGKFCKPCKNKLVKTLNTAYEDLKEGKVEERVPRMRSFVKKDEKTGIRFNNKK